MPCQLQMGICTTTILIHFLFSSSFDVDRHELALGNTFRAKSGALPPVSETSPTVCVQYFYLMTFGHTFLGWVDGRSLNFFCDPKRL
jgi:hypothetical protein